jgi:hypothetical protein
MRYAFMALGLLAAGSVRGQDSTGFHAMVVATTGVAAPAGPLAAETRIAPTVYVGLAFHHGRSRTSFEIGQSFTALSTGGAQHASISVTAVTVTRVIPIAPNLETYVALGLGQSWATGSAVDTRILPNASHFGVATLAGTGLRYGGRVGGLVAIQYMGLVHSGTLLQVIPVQLGVSLR